MTPNWMLRLPGAEYEGENPDGFMHRDEVVNYLEDYVRRFQLPVQTGITVKSVEPSDGDNGFVLRTDKDTIRASNVVVATGTFQKPRIPDISKDLPKELDQLHTRQSGLFLGVAEDAANVADTIAESATGQGTGGALE